MQNRCPLCSSPSSTRRDWGAFLRTLSTADREKLLREASAARQEVRDRPPIGRIVERADGGMTLVRDQSPK
jgi:hypothetical protein